MAYAGTADRGFAERIARIEKGKQWTPDGVVVPSTKARKKKIGLKHHNRRITMMLSVLLVGCLVSVFSHMQAELAEEDAEIDLSGVTALFSTITGG
ncbi:hypothetical protein [Tropicimonas sediminicola]|uniref:Uncharacterized protein n=1 Tax=Tropicimonas sediminicola TaxID=1031541 RepID=A0A239H116_9RHOB|nr:hypothetical protein [Tropicimonas sediminicola]SNS74861.1 hypothetical protein SAMN05421757_103191 [Tropicimonas sediminicola]